MFKSLNVLLENEEGLGSGLVKEYMSIVRDMFETNVEWAGIHYLFEGVHSLLHLASATLKLHYKCFLSDFFCNRQ